jgi:FG-GAP-like repeat
MTVLLNLGDGVYGPPTVYKAGREVVTPALGDFDGDGDLDAAVTNARDDTISVFLNDGTGVFGAQVTYATGTMPRSLVAADLNGDGDADLAVLNVASSDVSVLLSSGDGTFAPEVRVFVGDVSARGDTNKTFPVPGPSLAGGDLDNDGDVDLAIPCGGEVRVLVNDGAGGFSLAPQAPDVLGGDAYDIAIADLNGDGLSDLAVVVRSTPLTGVNVVLNQGGLSFAPPAAYSADYANCQGCLYNFTSIDAGDIDDDGDPDLVIGSEYGGRVFVAYRNAGDGTFGPFEMHWFYLEPWVVELEDVTGDGHEDLVGLTYEDRSGLRIYVNDGSGNLVGPEWVARDGDQSEQNWRMAAGDLNGDGYTDVATVRGWSNVEFFEGHANGTFTFRGEADVGVPVRVYNLAMGDVNADGLSDLVLADAGEDGFEDSGDVWVVLQVAPFQFEVLAPIPLDDAQGYEVAVGDLDGDGDLDAAVRLVGVYQGGPPVDLRVMVLLNDGSGNLSPVQELTFASQAWSSIGALVLGDLDSDGDLDCLAAASPSFSPGVLAMLTNDGTGELSIASTMEVPPDPQSFGLEDFNGDGSLDLALLCNHNGSPTDGLAFEAYLSIAMNDGTGAFDFMQQVVDVNSHSNGQLVGADFDNDGDTDLALPDMAGFVEVHLNDGAGQFGPGARYTGIDHTPALAADDVDADGRVDLIGANAYGPGLMVFRNRYCPACPADLNGDGMLNILDFVAFQVAFQAGDVGADCDGDGRLEYPADFVCFQELFQAGCP